MLGTILVSGLTLFLWGSPIPVPAELEQPDRCVTFGDAGVPYDCEDEREVSMHILLSHEANFEECSGGCDQTFIAWCGDYWSGGHQTRHAILYYEASGPDDQITRGQLTQSVGQGRFRVHRKLNCDLDPLDLGNALECDDFGCYPDCCREISHFISLASGDPVLVDEMKSLGTLPCFVLQRNPFIDAEGQQEATPPNIGVHPSAGARPPR